MQRSLSSTPEGSGASSACPRQCGEGAVSGKGKYLEKKSACPWQKMSPAKKYKLYKSSINKSLHFV